MKNNVNYDKTFHAQKIRLDMFNFNVLFLYFNSDDYESVLNDNLFKTNKLSPKGEPIFSSYENMKEMKSQIEDVFSGYDSYFGITIYNKHDIIIYVNNNEEDPDHLSILVHEVSHAVDHVFSFLSIENNTEVRAYMMGYIFKSLYPNMLKYKDDYSKN